MPFLPKFKKHTVTSIVVLTLDDNVSSSFATIDNYRNSLFLNIEHLFSNL